MTTTRKTHRKTPPVTRSEAEDLLGRFRLLKLQEIKITSDREAAVAEIDSRVGPELEKINVQLTHITKELQRWAVANCDTFQGNRSIEMVHGTIGWRTNPPKVNLPKTDHDLLLDIVERNLGTQYLRCAWEIDKESLLADRAQLDAEALKRTNITITQTETFFVKPTLPDNPTHQTIIIPTE